MIESVDCGDRAELFPAGLVDGFMELSVGVVHGLLVEIEDTCQEVTRN
jgi:hypothetical protein